MKNTVNLHLLSLVANDYPGIATDINLVCGGNKATFTKGFIIYDTVPGPLAISFTTSLDDVNDAIVEGSTWKPATKIVDCTSAVNIVSEPYEDVLAAANSCCGSSLQLAAFSFKISPAPLTVGTPIQCVPAAFKWMTTIPASDPKEYIVKYMAIIKDSANGNTMNIVLSQFTADQATLQANQLVLNWPADFVGKTDGVTTLVANSVVPGVGERKVGFYDNGTINVQVQIFDNTDPEDPVVIKQSNSVFQLPATLPCCPVLVSWQHNGNAPGRLLIEKNGDTVIDSNAPGESGEFYANAGDELTATVSGSPVTLLSVENNVDDVINESANPFTWTLECGKTYSIFGNTSDGE